MKKPTVVLAADDAALRRRVRSSSSLGNPHAPGATPLQRMIGESLPMQRIKAYIGQVAMTDSTVLITGESGTGKGPVAEMIHRFRPIRRFPAGACPRHRTAIV
jgi:two-component system, NtrC family, response regulator PilR